MTLRHRQFPSAVGSFAFLVLVSTLGMSLVVAVVGPSSKADAAKVRPTLGRVITKFSSDAKPTRAIVEQTLGVKLKTKGGTDAFAVYKAPAILLADARVVEVELRVARPGVEVTAGPLLVLRIDNSAKRCIDRETTLQKYGPLQLSQAPRGGSLDDEASFARTETWGQISVGFAERASTCLSSVTFNYDL
jgi:hypothetical protein